MAVFTPSGVRPRVILRDMSAIEDQVESLHQQLAELYRGRSVDYHQINSLWWAIERLERDMELAEYASLLTEERFDEDIEGGVGND